MQTRGLVVMITLIVSFLFGTLPVDSGQEGKNGHASAKGRLELECNIAGVDLHACPSDQFERKTIRKFFGLFTSYQESCSGKEMFLGATPLKPIELPEGRYVLLTPPDYAWEHEGPIEVNVTASQKTFFLLKLFKRYRAQGDGGSGEGGPGGGGSGAGGGVGSSP